MAWEIWAAACVGGFVRTPWEEELDLAVTWYPFNNFLLQPHCSSSLLSHVGEMQPWS